MYRQLKSEKIIETISILNRRIKERFPNSELTKVCRELQLITEESHDKIVWIKKPNYLLRFSIIGLLLLIFSITMTLIPSIKEHEQVWELADFVQSLDAIAGVLIVLGFIGIFFFNFEKRIKSQRAIKTLHALRAIAHVIDMHQLTKDPHRVLKSIIPTKSSPKLDMDAHDLTRYFDYCSEMLSLVGKVAALYGQDLKDTTSLLIVNDIETMTAGFSRKIWQKIMIVNKYNQP